MISYFNPMVINPGFICYVFLLLILGSLGCNCKEDMYGEHLELEVPINTYPSQDTFDIGDTLWIEARFNKNVKVRNNTTNTIFLEDFPFYTLFGISEISDSLEMFNVEFDIIEIAGTMEKLPLPTAISYPINYNELNDQYYFKAGIILKDKGLFYTRFSTQGLLYENINHPAVYTCKDIRRNRIDVYYKNQSTSLDAYNNLFLTTQVDYLLELMHFQRYSDVGAHTFYVKP